MFTQRVHERSPRSGRCAWTPQEERVKSQESKLDRFVGCTRECTSYIFCAVPIFCSLCSWTTRRARHGLGRKNISLSEFDESSRIIPVWRYMCGVLQKSSGLGGGFFWDILWSWSRSSLILLWFSTMQGYSDQSLRYCTVPGCCIQIQWPRMYNAIYLCN